MNVIAVVLNWRRPTQTIACVRSLAEVPTIVVDNASGDDSVPVLREALPGVELIEHTSNDGYAGGNNVGIRRALERSPDAVLIVNNDLVVAPDAVELLTAALGRGAGIAAPLSVLPDGRIDFYTARVDLQNMALLARGRDEPEPVPPLSEPVPSDYATGSAMLVDVGLLDRLGGFDERYFLVWEDVDLSLRARAQGARIVVDPRARVTHERSASFGGDGSPLYKYFFVRNSFLVLEAHGRWPWRKRARERIERRYEGWAATPGDEPAARAIALGLEHGLTGRFGPPPPELVP